MKVDDLLSDMIIDNPTKIMHNISQAVAKSSKIHKVHTGVEISNDEQEFESDSFATLDGYLLQS